MKNVQLELFSFKFGFNFCMKNDLVMKTFPVYKFYFD